MIRGGMVTLHAGDVSASVRFYVETLGLKLAEERADGSAVIDAGEGLRIGLRPGKPPSGDVVLTLQVKVPLADAVAIYENRGVIFTKTPAGATFRDPAGNQIALV